MGVHVVRVRGHGGSKTVLKCRGPHPTCGHRRLLPELYLQITFSICYRICCKDEIPLC